MVKMKKQQIEQIIANELPGHRLAQSSNSVDAKPVKAEASTPEIDRLMKKFGLGSDEQPETDGSNWDSKLGNGDITDDEIVLVEKTDQADPLSRGNRPKAKVLSPEGKVTGSQG